MTAATRRWVSYALAAALLVALAFAVLFTVFGPGESDASASTQESQARAEVQRVASAFAVNVNTYSSQQIGGYTERVKPLLTQEFEKSFNRAIDGIVKQMQAVQIESEGEVLVTGVSSLDEDSATVLVVSDADVTTGTGDRARHFRWQVDLVKQGGEWLVNGFEPL